MQRIALIGCGRLGSAFVRGWGEAGRFEIAVLDPAAGEVAGAARLASMAEVEAWRPDLVVLAVKPQVLPGLLPEMRGMARAGVVFISVAGGVTLDTLDRGLGLEARIVRAMPNTPAAVLKGITAAIAGEALGRAERDLCHAALSAVGEVVWLTEESWMDAVTAVSGSGPAYFFRFAEALARAGEDLGLPPALSMQLARATFVGAGALAGQTPETLAELRQAVTSPGGTTAAGLGRLDSYNGLDRLVASAAAEAAERSRQLACEAAAKARA